MAKQCSVCAKSSQMAGGYSNRVRATKYNPTGLRRQKPNLQWTPNPSGGRMLACAKCIKKGKSLVK